MRNSTKNSLLIVLLSKYLLMISLIFLYLPLFKYLCGNLDILKVSATITNTFDYLCECTILNLNTTFDYYLYKATLPFIINIQDSNSYTNVLDITCDKTTLFNIQHNVAPVTINVLEFKDTNLKEVFFTTSTTIDSLIFYPLQKKIYTPFNETSLVFFRMVNNQNIAINGITTYTVFPLDALPFIKKLQCFCFDELRLLPNETVDLPVLFYIEPFTNLDNKLTFCYTFLEISI
jgi:cytochrome c oxidase assembly protein Cox11